VSERLIEAYLVHLTLANYRPTTLLARGTCLRAFHRTLDGRDLTQATRIDAEAYMSRTLRPESRRAYKGHLRAFYRWALDEEYVTADPTAKLAPVRVPKAVPRPISEEQLVVAVAAGDARMKVGADRERDVVWRAGPPRRVADRHPVQRVQDQRVRGHGGHTPALALAQPQQDSARCRLEVTRT
jgi:site-specific recombinase XerD